MTNGVLWVLNLAAFGYLMFQIGAAWEFTHPRDRPAIETKADKFEPMMSVRVK